jgi:hypothetical protein
MDVRAGAAPATSGRYMASLLAVCTNSLMEAIDMSIFDEPFTEIGDSEADEEDAAEPLPKGSVPAVVTGTDWTAETVVSQLRRGNIDLNPRFQRRDAWKTDRKSRLIESLILGLPVPQIVLAEAKDSRGRFIVIDGKQRLLTLLQFWGLGEGTSNGFALTGLGLRSDLNGRTFADFERDSALHPDLTALLNESVRTVVIKNWTDSSFLHTVFLRLNTGSVALSPQELRQALLPGPFTDFVDDASAGSKALRELLGLIDPDPRMRDVEILARFIAFHFFGDRYPGRMKGFLDMAFDELNSKWRMRQRDIEAAVADFESGLLSLMQLFGKNLARKPGSRQFNRAIFDALIYYHSQPAVRDALAGHDQQLVDEYADLLAAGSDFATAIESDTASPHNTLTRLQVWADRLNSIAGLHLSAPPIPLPGRPAKSKGKKAKKKATKKKQAKG